MMHSVCVSSSTYSHFITLHSVLIDVNKKYREAWEAAGGIFILHTSSKQTLKEMREKRILTG